MTTELASYPALQNAIERRRSAMARETQGDRRLAQDDQWAAWLQANRAYARELLPQLLGGAWTVSRHVAFGLVGLNALLLFDHPWCFRRKGMRGPNRWDICALIAHPYHLNGADQQVAELRRQGVGVWASDDLSAWYPGATVMTLAAKGLHLMPVPDGFRLLELPTASASTANRDDTRSGGGAAGAHRGNPEREAR